MRGSAALRTGVAPGGALVGPWVQNPLWTAARAVPSLDLRFADNKSLTDATTGQNLVTFTRASSGTFVGSNGVLRTAVTNLATFSEAFNDASWTKNSSSITADAATAPNGTVTADKVVEDTSNGAHGLVKYPTVLANSTITASAYVKKAERQYLRLSTGDAYGGNSAGARINLDTGTIASTFTSGTNPPTNVSAQIQAVGGEWYRVSVTCTLTGSSVNSVINVNAVDSSYVGYTGDGTSGFFFWGAQLEQSATVGEYIPTTSTINSAPRFDHNPTTGESLGLLVEEQRTNLLLRSEELDNASWNSSAGARTVTANSVAAPDGLSTADTVTADGTAAAHFVSQSLTLAAVPYAYSVFAKAGTNNFLQLRLFSAFGGMWANFNLATGVVGTVGVASGAAPTSSIQAYPNGWYRCTMGFTPTAATSSVAAYIVDSASAVGGATNSLSTTIYLWGVQLEAGAFPTSYIPTTTAAATRSADLASITGTAFSSWYRQDEGTVFADFNGTNITSGQFPRIIELKDETLNNFMRIQQYGANLVRASVNTANVNQFAADNGSVAVGIRGKSAFGSAFNDAALVTNGASATVDTAYLTPGALTQLGIGSQPGTFTSLLNSTIRRLTYWPQRLPNSTLQTITQ